jgi:holo-[acyl-carrier protein] synthase
MRAIGVDLIEVDRVAQTVARFGDRFLKRVYTEQELAYCQGRIASLAARWAAKEAVAKALGTGIGDVSWQEIEVINSFKRGPSIQLHGAAAAHLEISGLAVSLSHTKDYAIAFVVAEK